MSLLPLSLPSLVVSATAALLEGLVAVTERKRFVEILGSREIRQLVFFMRGKVSPDAQISGNALSCPVTGTGDWKDGCFCRKLDWYGTPIPFNAQRVKATEDKSLRFTVNKGAGDYPIAATGRGSPGRRFACGPAMQRDATPDPPISSGGCIGLCAYRTHCLSVARSWLSGSGLSRVRNIPSCCGRRLATRAVRVLR